uniref:Uncharacterized protein n=1 Tax=Trichuris muris TaxID=70415 RepID=A0A5S6QS69_TRIMR
MSSAETSWCTPIVGPWILHQLKFEHFKRLPKVVVTRLCSTYFCRAKHLQKLITKQCIFCRRQGVLGCSTTRRTI